MDGEHSLQALVRSNGPAWTVQFAEWLGGLNRRASGLEWWAHTSNAKNPLSSTLYDRYVRCRVVAEFVQQTPRRREVLIRGGSPGQRLTLYKLLKDAPPGLSRAALRWAAVLLLLKRVDALLRVAKQLVQVLVVFLPRQKPRTSMEVCLFTYSDVPVAKAEDPYFGSLKDILQALSGRKVQYVVYAGPPYRAHLTALSGIRSQQVTALFDWLRLRDYWFAFNYSARAAIRPRPPQGDGLGLELPLGPLLVDAMLDDVRVGGYLHNILVNRAILRMLKACQPEVLIYPYENKALEKSLLLGAIEADVKTRTVGYQHTSLSARHLNLMFSDGEADNTPLPNRIVTLGEVTASYLRSRGNYPPGVIRVGCALRQKWHEPILQKAIDPEKPRILIALSSSPAELRSAIVFARRLKQIATGVELGIRTHPTFPPSLLSQEDRGWFLNNATDFSGTLLRDNFDWCDCVIYVSSTVALEALMAGRPVINIRMQDTIDPNPILQTIANAWQAETAEEVIHVVRMYSRLSELDRCKLVNEARHWLRQYFHAPDACTPQAFLDFGESGDCHDPAPNQS